MVESLDSIKSKIQSCLKQVYAQDAVLFSRNNGKGLCERCLVFRFGLYLQNEFNDYYVDCDFNSYSETIIDNNGRVSQQLDGNGKPIENPDGTTTHRFVDIIVHNRTFDGTNDFICFEVKKWNNQKRQEVEKDKNNLRVLTSDYGYHYGFYLVLGQTQEKTKWEIYQNGRVIEELHNV